MKQNWKYQKMGDTFVLQMGKTPPRKNEKYWGGNNTWISIGDMGNSKFISSSKEKISDLAIKDTGIKIVPKGTVIMSFKLSVGKVGIANSDLYSNEAIMAFIPKCETTIISDYLFYYLKGYKWENSNRAVKGITLNKELISKGIIAIPGIEEQRLIVEELDLIQSIIDKQKRQLLELDNLQQSIFHNMFGDLLDNKKSNKTLKEVAEYFIGLTYKPSDVSNSGTIVLRSSNIQGNQLDFKDIVRVSINVSEKKKVKEGDILMCARNGSAKLVGKVARIKKMSEEMSFGAFMTIIRSRYNDFLFHFFKSAFFRSQLNSSKTATINQITSKMLDKIKVPIPPLALQEEFAEKIEAIERQKELIKKSIADSEQLFNYTMDKYFG